MPTRPVSEDRRRRQYRDYETPATMPKPPIQNGGPHIDPRDTTPLSVEEGIKLVTLARAGNICARDRLVASCDGMLFLWVRKYARGSPHLFEDMLAECRIAVMQSIALYDATRGMKFSSYAMFRVRNVCFETMRAQRWTVNLPIVRNPEKAMKFGGRTRTHSTTLIGADGEEYEMTIPSWDPDPDVLLHARLKDLVQTVLTDRERDILESHLQREQTFEEIAARYSLSRERIRQLEERALRKLKVHLSRRSRPQGPQLEP